MLQLLLIAHLHYFFPYVSNFIWIFILLLYCAYCSYSLTTAPTTIKVKDYLVSISLASNTLLLYLAPSTIYLLHIY